MNSPKRYVGSLVIGWVVIIALAVVISSSLAHRVDTSQRANLLQQAQYAALLVTPADLSVLTGTEKDLDNSVYQRIKNNLTAFRGYNPDIRFVYLMGYKPEVKLQFFYVDSEEVNSEDYSPPGQLFTDTRQSDIDAYIAGAPYTDGPYKDSWGEWVSGYVPMVVGGETVAMLGIDIATSVWREQIGFIRIVSWVIAALLGLLYWGVVRAIYKKQLSIEYLTEHSNELERRGNTLEEIQKLAHLGRLTIYFKDDTVRVDSRLAELFAKETLSVGEFFGAIHPEDRESVEGAFAQMKHQTSGSVQFDARFDIGKRGFVSYRVVGIIQDDQGHPKQFSGIMQEA